ncbi:MAG: helix-turn-helix domain-containing protein [Promethearchaeota archaeon]
MLVENIVQKVSVLLKKANYETFTIEEKNKYCFDLLVKKESAILLIKVFSNIDNLNMSIINGIKSMSILLKSKPILIGIKNRYQKLEDNTIYIREDLPFITYNTFENTILNQSYPYVLARRGGGVIFLDGVQMKELREKKNINRKGLSEELEVTKRTICSYENESMRPSQQIAEKIIKILEDPKQTIFKSINIFEWNVKFNINDEHSFAGQELSPFESHIQDVIQDIGIEAHWYKKGLTPFEMSIHCNKYERNCEENAIFPLFSKVPSEKGKASELSFKYFLYMFSQLFQKKGIFIVDNDFRISDTIRNKKIPILKMKNLEKIDNEFEFVEFIQKDES